MVALGIVGTTLISDEEAQGDIGLPMAIGTATTTGQEVAHSEMALCLSSASLDNVS